MKKTLLYLFIVLFSNLNYAQSEIDSMVVATHDSINKYYNNKKKYNLTELNKEIEKIKTHYDKITEYYSYHNTKKETLKGIRFYHENDMLGVFSKNLDHEYTGAFKIDFITDFFGLKILSWRRDNSFLSYQSLTLGFELYTPENINVTNPNDLNHNDRPFASFQYIGRTRNLLSLNGTRRITSEIKFGIIGGNVSRNIQMVTHNDIKPGSSINKGWDYQIGNGGRLGIQYDLSNEWQKMLNKKLYFQYGFDTGAGHIKCYISPKATLTNKNFYERNPHNAIKTSDNFGTKGLWTQVKSTFFYEVNYQPEYVAWNTMLQGYPFDNAHNVIGNNDDTIGIPVIENIKNIVHNIGFGFGAKNYKTTIHLQYNLRTPEYNIDNNLSWNNKRFHHYGRLSFTMNI